MNRNMVVAILRVFARVSTTEWKLFGCIYDRTERELHSNSDPEYRNQLRAPLVDLVELWFDDTS